MNMEKVRWTGWQLASLVDTKKIREKAGLSTLAVSAAIVCRLLPFDVNDSICEAAMKCLITEMPWKYPQ